MFFSKKILETARLELREWNPDNAEFLLQLNSDPEVIRYTGDSAFDTIDSAYDFISNYDHYTKYGYGHWLCVLKNSGEPIGWCGLKNQMEELGIIDLGYRIIRSEWGKGFATEAASGTLDYGFETLQLDEIAGRVAIGNDASAKVLNKLGMKFWKHETCDHHPANWYSLGRGEWKKLKKFRAKSRS